jgi:hypothetical protein
MGVSAINYKGTRIGESISNLETTPEEKIRITLLNKFDKGVIDKDLFVKATQQLDDLVKGGKKTGEGSRGGHIIGHTQSGKPIYSNPGSENHKHFSEQDHSDAAHIHLTHTSRLITDHDLDSDKKAKFNSQEHHKRALAHLQKIGGRTVNDQSSMSHAHKQVYNAQYHYDRMKHHQESGDKAHKAGDPIAGELHYKQAQHHFKKYSDAQGQGHEIGKTKSGKAVYADPHHASHSHFDAQDHADARDHHMNKMTEAMNRNDHEAFHRHHQSALHHWNRM